MSFLSPLWLALGVAAAIPVLLHLLRLRRGVQVEFPAIQFLLRAEREHRREMRLRNLVLMLLRVAIVLFVALAAARPLGGTGGAGHAPTALAIVLDNSMSSGAVRGGGSALEALQRAAGRVLDAATPEDRVWLLTVDGQVTTGGVPAVRDAIERAQTMGGAGDLVASVERASSLVRTSGLRAAAIVVLTDGQATQWPRAARAEGIPVTVVALGGTPPRNRAVREARPSPVRWVPRGSIDVAISSADSADVRVALGDRTLTRTTLGPDGTIAVRGVAERDGWMDGRVELAPDELRGDDVRYFAVFAGDAPSVRVDPSAGHFARAAMETLADAGRVRIGNGVAVVGAEGAVRRPVLAFAPLDPVRVGAANRALAANGIPWKFGPVSRGETSVRDGELEGVRVMAHYPLEAAGATTADTLATAGGAPWVVAGEGFVLVGSALDPAVTSLPVWAEFLPWLESLIARYLLADGGRVVWAAPLDSVAVPIGVDELTSEEQPAAAVTGRMIEAPARAGVYWMRRAGALVGALVVNADPRESELASLDGAGLESRIVGGEVRVLDPAGDVGRAAFSTTGRRPLLGVVLVGLLVLLLVESLLARATPAAARSAG